MKKQWVKNNDFNYTFWVDEKQIGEMEIFFNATVSKAVCNINGKVLEIERTGFWKSSLHISDGNKAVVLKMFPEKWYANTSIVEFDRKKYKLIVRNNPLAEYAVTENDKDFLAYGLAAEHGDLQIKISTWNNPDVIFDFVLWYLFLPVANENFGDSYSFYFRN